MSCERCGMFTPEGPQLTIGQLLGSDPITGDEPPMPPHECPDPFDFDDAKKILAFYGATQIPMDPTTYARCVLAYRLAGVEV